ncbi:MAG: redoxin domain-containing protein, partial [Candidatus Coatesbacteria bacterium]
KDRTMAGYQHSDLARDTAAAYLRSAGQCCENGAYDEAEEHYRNALETAPDFAEAHLQYGQFLRQTDRAELAEEHYRKALELAPDDYRGPYFLGYLYACTEGKQEEGLALYRRAMELGPEEHAVRAEYGRVLLNLGRVAEAEEAFLKLLEVGGDNAYTLICLGYVEQQKEAPEAARARDYYARGVARLEEDGYDAAGFSFAYFNLAHLAAEAGDVDQALECINALLHIDLIEYKEAFETEEAFAAVRADPRYAELRAHADEHFNAYLEENCSVMPGKKAPDFKLEDLAGNKVRLKDFRGRLVLVNIWATWCGPCRAEIPDISAVYEEYKDKGVVVLGLSTDDELSGEELKEAAEAFGAAYPILRSDEKTTRAYIEKSGSIPETYFVGPDGRVLDFIVGRTNRLALETRVKKYLPS